MPRIARAVLAGVPYHVTHRGNRRTETFYSDDERIRYLSLFGEVAAQEGVRAWAYCLMPNHVHWILVPDQPDALGSLMRRAHGRFAAWLNHRHGWRGHLWASRFFSTALDDRYLWFAARYVELNPVRAKLVTDPLDYAWSSARANSRGARDLLLDPARPFARHPVDWEDWLRATGETTPSAEDELRRNTLTGRPTGSESFVRQLELQLGRTLTVRTPGRPVRDENRRGGQPSLGFDPEE